MTVSDTGSDKRATSGEGATGYVLAGASVAAGAIHFAMIPAHASEGLLDALGFAAAAWFQIAIAGLVLLRRASKAVLWTAVVGNAALIGLWIWSRTAGLPFGGHSGVAEDAAALDVVCVILEAVVIVVALSMVLSPRAWRIPSLAAVVAGVSALALATVVMVQPESAEHGHTHDDGSAETTAAHSHGSTDPVAHNAEMLKLESQRCDRDLNVGGYYDEARTLGIDTLAGGAMSADDHATATLADSLRPDPLHGRGSEQLDALIRYSSNGDSEAAAAALVVALSRSSDKDYAAWLDWMKSTSHSGSHHGATSSAAPDDTGGHGGHMGPTPWTALIDKNDCATLRAELKVARDTALRYPTAQDAMDAGWRRVTGYVPGIAAHYMNFSLVDGVFAVDKPEMILYDGGGPDARVVGLSYYVVSEGPAEPTQGFTGVNDHYHRHIGLCVNGTGVIGDSTTTEEDCAARRGGRKQGGSGGWMSHAWVVPGCESPWGLFSGANPLLENELASVSGQNAGACAASGVRDRYNLEAQTKPDSTPVSANAAKK